MCRRSFQVDSFVERACVTLATGVSGHVLDKETLKTVLVEKREQASAEARECESGSRKPSMRIRRTTAL